MPLKLRPTFSVDLPRPSREVAEELRVGLEKEQIWTRWSRAAMGGNAPTGDDSFAMLALPEEQQRLWSPWLQLCINASDKGTHLFGRFSPRPAVWTAVALSYLFLFCILFFSSMAGIAQVLVKQSPWMFWITSCAALTMVILWAVAQAGKALANDQMHTLRDAVSRCCPGMENAD